MASESVPIETAHDDMIVRPVSANVTKTQPNRLYSMMLNWIITESVLQLVLPTGRSKSLTLPTVTLPAHLAAKRSKGLCPSSLCRLRSFEHSSSDTLVPSGKSPGHTPNLARYWLPAPTTAKF